MVFDHQIFAVSALSGRFVSGSTVIAYLSINKDLKPWPQLGILFAFVIIIRVLHFILLWVNVYPYVKYQLSWSKFVSAFRLFGATGDQQAAKSSNSATLAL